MISVSENDIVIEVENLSKQYKLGTIGHGTLYRDLQSWWAKLRGKDDPNSQLSPNQPLAASRQPLEDFWALRDVSFEVRRGEVVGIIGRNGAGKSTLLKILSRVTGPTSGSVKIKGRVASLLEVGTGFHPELTGRENIYLNGTILGMKKKEIDAKFDEIVAFAEIEQFIDTPVKRYSSGMYVRLAFAVAAHLEPEILIVDEVLAVGDIEFQKKCLGKMKDISGEGRTVLFVSHNMQAIRQLCGRGILLEKGSIKFAGSSQEALNCYSNSMRDFVVKADTDVNNEMLRRGSGSIRFDAIILEDLAGKVRNNFSMGETLRFKLTYKAFAEMRGIKLCVALRSGLTREVVTTVEHIVSKDIVSAGSVGYATIDIENINIRPGEYPLYLHVSESVPTKVNYDVLDDLVAPLIIDAGTILTFDNFNPEKPIGYFSLTSKVVQSEIFAKEND